MSSVHTDKTGGKALAIFGAFVMLATFIAKEVLAESLKDALSGIDDARTVFKTQDVTIRSANPLLFGPPPAADALSLEQVRTRVRALEIHAFSNFGICLDLAQSFSRDLYRYVWSQFNKVSSEFQRIDKQIEGLADSDPGSLATARILYKQALDQDDVSNSMHVSVSVSANQQSEGERRKYVLAKWASYLLFGLGWYLNIRGIRASNSSSAGI